VRHEEPREYRPKEAEGIWAAVGSVYASLPMEDVRRHSGRLGIKKGHKYKMASLISTVSWKVKKAIILFTTQHCAE
jgi:hypothetical protein